MNKFIKNKILLSLLILLFFAVSVFSYYFLFSSAPHQEKIKWGINFSQMQAESLKLDWKEAYSAILSDLEVKNAKILTNWDLIETSDNLYYFDDVDWQLEESKKYNTDLIYVVGMKSSRWPECHMPNWAKSLSKEQQQGQILEYIEKVILRYRDNKSIIAWQAENEPLFQFGECPWYDKSFLAKEVALIKSLDSTRPVIVSDTGEYSFWLDAAKIGDMVGITMYKKIWVHITDKHGFYSDVFFPPVSYWRRVQIIKKLFNKEVIGIELQAEPWSPDVFINTSLKDQEKTMNLSQFKKNVNFAKKTGINEFYLWGAEWWYWLKEKQDRPEIWNEAKQLFKEN